MNASTGDEGVAAFAASTATVNAVVVIAGADGPFVLAGSTLSLSAKIRQTLPGTQTDVKDTTISCLKDGWQRSPSFAWVSVKNSGISPSQSNASSCFGKS